MSHSLFDHFYEDLNKATGQAPKTAVQSVLVPRAKFSLEAAKKWIRSHDYAITKPPDVTEKYYRFRQDDPAKFSRMRTVSIGSGIQLIVGWK